MLTFIKTNRKKVITLLCLALALAWWGYRRIEFRQNAMSLNCLGDPKGGADIIYVAPKNTPRSLVMIWTDEFDEDENPLEEKEKIKKYVINKDKAEIKILTEKQTLHFKILSPSVLENTDTKVRYQYEFFNSKKE